jgi:outer membrane lipoprotein-sorting protein
MRFTQTSAAGAGSSQPPHSTGRHPAVVGAFMVVMCLPLAPGQAQTTRPTQPATTSSPSVDPAARKVLDELEKAGETYQTISSDIDYQVYMSEVGDMETRTGSVIYRKGDANATARFRIQFNTLRQGEDAKVKPREDKVEYAFDGTWLNVAKHSIKQMTRYQVAAPGERVELLKIGKGPFPLPFGQKADDVVRHFEVTLVPPKQTDPKDTDHLRLITREGSRKEINFRSLEMWVDRKTPLPVRIISADRKDNITTVDFKNVKTNVQVKDDTFHILPPVGWELILKRLGEN